LTENYIPKVIFLNPWERLIGPNRYLAEMLKCLPELAEKSTVIFHNHTSAMAEYEDMGCTVIVLPEIAQIRAHFSLKNIMRIILNHSFGLLKAIKLIRSLNPDIIVSNTEQLLLGDIASRLLNIPHIKIFHAITFAYRLGRRPSILNAYLKTITLGSDRVIAVSETLRKALLSGRMEEKKIVSISNPIPVDALKTSAGEIPPNIHGILKDHKPVILSAGQFFPKKGQDQLIEALPYIRKVFPIIICIFAGKTGEGSGMEDTQKYFQSLQSRIAELRLHDNVFFAGEIDYLPALMHRADIYVQTSWTESFNRAAAEALICGAPVVAYNAGATEEVSGPGAALVKAGDIRGLAHAITELLNQPELRKQLVVKGARHIESHFNAPKIAERFISLLKATARGKTTASARI
jgi:glycosyltransferase involved in cell wall biosynthesis